MPENGMTVVEASPDSHLQDALTRLHVQRINSLQSRLGEKHMRRIYNLILTHQLGPIFVATSHGNLVGFICLIPDLTKFKSYALKSFAPINLLKTLLMYPVFLLDIFGHIGCESALSASNSLYMAAIAVSRSNQALLASRMLMKRAKEHALKRGKGLSVLVRSKNKKALDFYRTYGFRMVKTFLNIHCLVWQPHEYLC